MGPREEQARTRLVEQWLAKAQTDLRAAEALLSHQPPLPYPACFHSQQSAEKHLKALLTWHQVEFPKTHAIGELLDLVAKVEPALAESLACATALNPYGVDVRYPGDEPEPGATDAEDALRVARKVRDAVSRALPRE